MNTAVVHSRAFIMDTMVVFMYDMYSSTPYACTIDYTCTIAAVFGSQGSRERTINTSNFPQSPL